MASELFLAGRYLRPRRSAVSLITLMSILGVTLGVMVLLVVMSVMTGFSDTMKKKMIETQAHFQIRYPHGVMGSPDVAVDAVRRAGADAAPVIQSPVLVQYGGERRLLDTQAVVFAAPEEALKKHIDVSSYIKAGTFTTATVGRKRHAVISENMAMRWGIGVGDKFLVHSASRLTSLVKFKAGGGIELNEKSSVYLPGEFIVSGIYSAGKSDFDRVVFFIDPDEAAELFDLPWGAATSVFGWGKDPFNQAGLLADIQKSLQYTGLEVVSWEESNRKFLDVLNVEKTMMFFLLIFIVLVAAFSITNTLITTVYQKTREIGLLKAIGCTNGCVMRIFVLQGLLVGVFGSIVGTGLGILVIHFRNDILNFASNVVGIDLFPKEFYFFNGLPARIVGADVTVIIVASVILCTAGALFPAWRASKLEPAEALRYE